MALERFRIIWLIEGREEETADYLNYPDELADKPEAIAEYMQGQYYKFPCRVKYMGISAIGLIFKDLLRTFQVEVMM